MLSRKKIHRRCSQCYKAPISKMSIIWDTTR